MTAPTPILIGGKKHLVSEPRGFSGTLLVTAGRRVMHAVPQSEAPFLLVLVDAPSGYLTGHPGHYVAFYRPSGPLVLERVPWELVAPVTLACMWAGEAGVTAFAAGLDSWPPSDAVEVFRLVADGLLPAAALDTYELLRS